MAQFEKTSFNNGPVLTTEYRIVRDYDIKLVDQDKEWKWAAYFTLNPYDWPVYVSQRKPL